MIPPAKCTYPCCDREGTTFLAGDGWRCRSHHGADLPLPPAVSKSSANSRQVGGDHYKTGGEEHWDRVARLKLDYFQGQVTKYVERWKKKNGVQDLKKARHFLDKYIELVEAGAFNQEKPNEP